MINLGRITRAGCINIPANQGGGNGGQDGGSCSDASWALANPQLCQQHLVMKPGVSNLCVGKSVQLGAFLASNSPLKEVDVTDKSVFTTTNQSVGVIGVSGGSFTAIAVGLTTISATYNGMKAYCAVNVVAADDCCADVSVLTMILVDTSKSMSLLFNSLYPSRLEFAKAAVNRVVSELNTTKDKIGFMTFNANQIKTVSAFSSSVSGLTALIPQISQTRQVTSFYDGVKAALDALEAETADRKVLMIISDGEDANSAYPKDRNPVEIVEDFKAAGGVVVTVGVRSNNAGYRLMETLSTDGFFINAISSNATTALDTLSGIKGYYCAGNCIPLGGVTIPQADLDYSAFDKWEVVGGKVDLYGAGYYDLLPGNGLYVNLAGSTATYNGELVTKDALALGQDTAYRITLSMAGNQRVDESPSSVRVQVFSLEPDDSRQIHFEQVISINDYAQGFKDYSFTFQMLSDHDCFIAVKQAESPASNQSAGILLNSVKLEAGLEILFSDDFNSENPTAIPSRTNNNGAGCLSTPPPAQRDDPDRLPDVESGATPPRIYTSVKNACATCQDLFVPVSLTPLISAIEQDATDEGTASAGINSSTAWKAFNNPAVNVIGGVLPNGNSFFIPNTIRISGAGIAGVNGDYVFQTSDGTFWRGGNDQNTIIEYHEGAWKIYLNGYQYSKVTLDDGVWDIIDDSTPPTSTANPDAWIKYLFSEAKTVQDYEITIGSVAVDSPRKFKLQGSNDGATWTTLDERDLITWFSNETKRFRISSPASYAGYRITFSGFNSMAGCEVVQLSFFVAGEASVCRTASYTSEISQIDADGRALDAAQALADAAIHCRRMFTKSESVTGSCPIGSIPLGGNVVRTATASSLNSENEARDAAHAAAALLVEADQDCSGSSNGQLIVTTAPPNGVVVKASLYPSVKYVSGVAPTISKVVVRLYGYSLNRAIQHHIALRSPNGTIVSLLKRTGFRGNVTPLPSIPGIPTRYTGCTLILDDSAGSAAPSSPTTGSGNVHYRPAQYGADLNLLSPFSTSPGDYHSALSAFNGQNPNGSWALIIVAEGNTGSSWGTNQITNWDLTITP